MIKLTKLYAIIIFVLAILVVGYGVLGVLKEHELLLEANLREQNLKEGADMLDIWKEGPVPPFVRSNKLATRIVWCESGNDPKVCNNKIYCHKGMGLFGIISQTWNSALIKMAKKNEFMPERCWEILYLSNISSIKEFRDQAIFDPVCNSMVGMWLLENEGVAHWGYEGADWGSYECWKNYLTSEYE